MSKKVKYISQELSDIIHEYFNGQLNKITKEKIINIYNDPKINIDFEKITKDNVKALIKLIKIINKKKDIRYLLKDKSDKYKKSIESIIKIDKKKDINYNDFKGEKYVSFQRKAFIDFINNDFYKNVIEINKNSELNIWQNFVKHYLLLQTPYRGLLVYHGLGTGKTATAVTTAEGLSENMEITTLLPASLETNFINEVKTWGEELFDLHNNNWIFISELDIIKDTQFRKMLFEKYKVTPEVITNIYQKSKKKTNDSISKGFWIISEDVDADKDKIKTVNGKILRNSKIETDKDCIKLSEGEKIQINIQIEICIKFKYNFIHYNPFPSVKSSSI